ncbi:MAG TPA: MBL fold metallo-hydrolase, partial [Solirubrobacteraceae bacterium]
ALSGHGKPFVDVHGHIEGNRRLIAERLDAVVTAIRAEPLTAVQIVPHVYEEELSVRNASWFLAQTLCYLRHLEAGGRVRGERDDGGVTDRWRAV